MKECLDYIKKIGIENNEINKELIKQKNINIELQQKIQKLELKIKDQQKELEHIREVSNSWWNDYDELNNDYYYLQAQYDFVVEALAQISPQLVKEMNEDLKDGKLSEIISNFSRRNRW